MTRCISTSHRETKSREAVACSEGSFRVPSIPGLLLPGSIVHAGEERDACLLLRHLDVVDHLAGTNAEQRLHLLFDLSHQGRAVLEIQLRVLATLPDLLSVVAVPRARLVDDSRFGR